VSRSWEVKRRPHYKECGPSASHRRQNMSLQCCISQRARLASPATLNPARGRTAAFKSRPCTSRAASHRSAPRYAPRTPTRLTPNSSTAAATNLTCCDRVVPPGIDSRAAPCWFAKGKSQRIPPDLSDSRVRILPSCVHHRVWLHRVHAIHVPWRFRGRGDRQHPSRADSHGARARMAGNHCNVVDCLTGVCGLLAQARGGEDVFPGGVASRGHDRRGRVR
jgi:hypothetical protein